MTKKDAKKITGGLSSPSKMPGKSYSLPPKKCRTGSVLSKHKGTVCADCYACKGRYLFSNVQNALQRRYESLYHPLWVESMITLLKDEYKYFRWHDSGDIDSVQHFLNILEVCDNLPEHKFRLPTKEIGMLCTVLAERDIPDNLMVRISSPVVDSRLPLNITTKNIAISTVYSSEQKAKNNNCMICPATTVRHTCDDCRFCWEVQKEVGYIKH